MNMTVVLIGAAGILLFMVAFLVIWAAKSPSCRFTVDAPAADVVEVVRCKDCKHFDLWFGETGCCKIHSQEAEGDVTMNEDDFCSYGERRTENGASDLA